MPATRCAVRVGVVMCIGVALLAAAALANDAEERRPTAAVSQFDVRLDGGAIVSLRRRDDAFDTEYIRDGGRLGDVYVQFRTPAGEWQAIDASELAADDNASPALLVESTFAQADDHIVWTLRLQNQSSEPLEIGDLAVPLEMNSSFRRGVSPNSAVLKHSFISGHGSFLFWMRPNSVGPFLTLTPLDGTKLEYWDSAWRGAAAPGSTSFAAEGPPRREYKVYIHSARAGEVARERGTDWRQPHTSLSLAAAGAPGDSQTYGFKLRWADDYDAVRQVLVDEGLLDVHVVPGMTVPTDLFAQFALRTKHDITAIEAEFPERTQIEALGRRGEYQLYQVRFARLGENRLTVRYGDGGDRHTYLEFFATEPLETLINKRAAFIARCQHRDPSKWYDGLISEWNMESQVLLGPDNYDRISGFRIYAVTCDDPGLSKPAYLAAKNAEFPVPSEIEALDYYLANFVWGGLQQTTDEPYPYAVYGIPDWKTNRERDDPGRNGQRHIWRVYDYPHVVLIYLSMYRVADRYPHIETRLLADEYLRRAVGTAEAMFTVPREVEGWSAYRTGFYNELVLVDLIVALEARGMTEEANALRDHWERKVRYFVNEKPNLFVSEYPFDSTGFESTHALARYAVNEARNGSEADGVVPLAAAERFMETQLAANIFCRGWLEPAYYYLGSDYRAGAGDAYTLSYMSQMGGWAVLDYALHFAADPAPYLRLGYNSYLSAWALMNTGTPESNYGYWYPGQENDGGAGGGFEPAPYGRTWLGQPHTRGSWYYACETDLGYCGALRMAATVLADDPIFGRFCFGGDWRATDDGIAIVPKDGLRKRVHAVLDAGRLHLELDTGRFAAGRSIALADDLSRVEFELESDNPHEHRVAMIVGGLADGPYRLRSGDETAARFELRDGRPARVELPIAAGRQRTSVTLERDRTAGDRDAKSAANPAADTFSIVAFDPATGDLGIAVASKILGVGSIVPWAKADVGAIATQSLANTAYGPEGLLLLEAGNNAKAVLQQLIDADDERKHRQVGIVDARGNVAAFTGERCHPWTGHRRGEHFTVQGNLLAGEEVLEKMAAAFDEARQVNDTELADWLMHALAAGDAAGGDQRGKQSAALLVVRARAGYGHNDRYIDLRVEDHDKPVAELQRLVDLHKEVFAWSHRNKPTQTMDDSVTHAAHSTDTAADTAAGAESANYPPPEEGDFVLRDFRFQSGETLPELRMHYLTIGKPERDADGVVRNAVLILHGTTGSSQQFLRPEFATELFGPGQLLDASQYYIVIPDNIGHGQSSKPSDGLRARFPRYGYRDMIAAQHRLLTEGLGVNHVRLVIGTSMGGMHTWLWGQTHPDFMDALLPLACLPTQISGRNRAWRRVIIDAIRNSPDWNDGQYDAQPTGMTTAAQMSYLMTSNAVLRLAEAPTLADADRALDAYVAEKLATLDANDVLYAFEASHDYDPGIGLEKIAAPLVAINFADDLINPPELAVLEREIKRVPRGRAIFVPLSGETVGHGTHTRAAVWKQHLAELLRESECE